ncbi:MAG: LysR family transcriptional regulator [Rhodospirillales bacterium]|nr:LysR family transcriptional regulator [Rhodospirillales bacterium]
MNITATNLNLFVAFDALIAERSVSRAAKRIGVTQSAMSNALRQMRTVFADPLFLRVSHGIAPTARALELAIPVREALLLLERALRPTSFDPRGGDADLHAVRERLRRVRHAAAAAQGNPRARAAGSLADPAVGPPSRPRGVGARRGRRHDRLLRSSPRQSSRGDPVRGALRLHRAQRSPAGAQQTNPRDLRGAGARDGVAEVGGDQRHRSRPRRPRLPTQRLGARLALHERARAGRQLRSNCLAKPPRSGAVRTRPRAAAVRPTAAPRRGPGRHGVASSEQ